MNKDLKILICCIIGVVSTTLFLTGELTHWGQSRDGGTTPEEQPVFTTTSQSYFACTNGFKLYTINYVNSHPSFNNNGIIPCDVNEFLPTGAINQTTIDYYQNTFTGSQPKSFKLASNSTFDIMTITNQGDRLYLAKNNDQFLLTPDSGGFLEIIIENYTSVDVNATIKANHGLLGPTIIGAIPGFYPDNKLVLGFKVNIDKPYLARITNHSESGMMDYAKIPIQIVSKNQSSLPIIYMKQAGISLSNQTPEIVSAINIPLPQPVKEPSYYAGMNDDLKITQTNRLLAMNYCIALFDHTSPMERGNFELFNMKCIQNTLEQTK